MRLWRAHDVAYLAWTARLADDGLEVAGAGGGGEEALGHARALARLDGEGNLKEALAKAELGSAAREVWRQAHVAGLPRVEECQLPPGGVLLHENCAGPPHSPSTEMEIGSKHPSIRT